MESLPEFARIQLHLGVVGAARPRGVGVRRAGRGRRRRRASAASSGPGRTGDRARRWQREQPRPLVARRRRVERMAMMMVMSQLQRRGAEPRRRRRKSRCAEVRSGSGWTARRRSMGTRGAGQDGTDTVVGRQWADGHRRHSGQERVERRHGLRTDGRGGRRWRRGVRPTLTLEDHQFIARQQRSASPVSASNLATHEDNYTELSAAFFCASSSVNRCVSFSRTTYENHCIQSSPNSAVQLLQYSTERAVHYSYTAR